MTIQSIDITDTEKKAEAADNIYNAEKNRIEGRKPNRETTTRFRTV